MARPMTSAPTRSRGFTDGGVLGCEDADEMGVMFVSQSRKLETAVDKVALKMGHFDRMTPYECKFVHISLRNGNGSIYIHADDQAEQPEETYELQNIINVKKVSLSEKEALQFTKFDEHEQEYTENVYGHLAIRLELLDAAYLPSYFSGDRKFNIEELCLAGKAAAVNLAFSSADDRDAWHAWFSELVVLRELMEIEMADNNNALVQLGEDGEAIRNKTDATVLAIERLGDFAHSGSTQRVVKDYTKKFLTKNVKLSRDADRDPPNKGKIFVRPPGSGKFSPQIATARITQGEIGFTARTQTKRFFAREVYIAQKLYLSDRTMIQASQPWSTDFEVYDVDCIWGFRCKTVEDRNAFIRWMRFCKGRGTMVSQTEYETFPYLRAVQSEVKVVEETNAESQIQLQFVKEMTVVKSEDDEADDDASTDGSAAKSDASPTRRRSSMARGADALALAANSDRTPVEPDADWDLSDISTPRSDTSSVDSVRPFHYFPTHIETLLPAYVDATAEVHMIGRVAAARRPHPALDGKDNIRSAKAVANAVHRLKSQAVGGSSGVSSRIGPSAGGPRSPIGGRVRARRVPKSPTSANKSATAGRTSSRGRRAKTPESRDPSPSPRAPRPTESHTPPARYTATHQTRTMEKAKHFTLRNNDDSWQAQAPRAAFSCHGQVLAATSVKGTTLTASTRKQLERAAAAAPPPR